MHIPHSPTEKKPRAICVFCGSSPGTDPHYVETARDLGRQIGERKFALIFGGGNIGLMGETARAARDAGAPVIGILPAFLRHLEPPLKSAEELIVLPDMFQRKDRMIALSDAFVLLPGGIGTLDEFFEVTVGAQLKVHTKPIVLVNVGGYFDPLRTLLEHLVAQGFVHENIHTLYRMVDTPKEALDHITAAIAETSAWADVPPAPRL